MTWRLLVLAIAAFVLAAWVGWSLPV